MTNEQRAFEERVSDVAEQPSLARESARQEPRAEPSSPHWPPPSPELVEKEPHEPKSPDEELSVGRTDPEPHDPKGSSDDEKYRAEGEQPEA